MSVPQPRALIVDDDAISVGVLEAMLLGAGVATQSTQDARRTIELVKSFRPDLLLLDLHMPVMDGFQVLQRVRSIVRPTDFLPIIVLTADSSPATRDRVLAAGADDFLIKPLEASEVTLRVRNLLRARSRHLALQQRIVDLERQVERESHARHEHSERSEKRVARIRAVLDGDAMQMHYQPIVSLRDGTLLGAEALARFSAKPVRPPHRWFAEAAQVGLGVELQVAAVRAAAGALVHLPTMAYLSVNLSADAVRAPEGQQALQQLPPERVVVELTEEGPVADDGATMRALAALRESGVRLAVDDAGSGLVRLREILELTPDIIKIGLAVTRGIDCDAAQRAVAAALVDGAAQVGATVVAEGVETDAELHVLQDLAIDAGQGYLLGRPQPHPPTEDCGLIAAPGGHAVVPPEAAAHPIG